MVSIVKAKTKIKSAQGVPAGVELRCHPSPTDAPESRRSATARLERCV